MHYISTLNQKPRQIPGSGPTPKVPFNKKARNVGNRRQEEQKSTVLVVGRRRVPAPATDCWSHGGWLSLATLPSMQPSAPPISTCSPIRFPLRFSWQPCGWIPNPAFSLETTAEKKPPSSPYQQTTQPGPSSGPSSCPSLSSPDSSLKRPRIPW